jgi:hypothetical protein
MIIRNCTSNIPKVAIDPSEYLRRTNVNDSQQRFFENGCPPEVLRRTYRPKHKFTGTIADNHNYSYDCGQSYAFFNTVQKKSTVQKSKLKINAQ